MAGTGRHVIVLRASAWISKTAFTFLLVFVFSFILSYSLAFDFDCLLSISFLC